MRLHVGARKNKKAGSDGRLSRVSAACVGKLRHISGAGEGNRTLVISLEGWSFTIKLHPHTLREVDYLSQHRLGGKNLMSMFFKLWLKWKMLFN